MRRPPSETPLMRQYLDVKERHPEAIVFFRLGDFYEMFYEDAILAARLLDLTLTTRDKGREDAVPMCGVPHHAARGYVARLVEAGHKVVIAEQVEDPRVAKGIVRREVVRVVTPGVQLDEEALDAKAPRYLAAVTTGGDAFGLAYLDVTTGEFAATVLPSLAALGDELARVAPRELLAAAALLDDGGPLAPLGARFPGLTVSPVEPLADAAARALLAEAVALAPRDPLAAEAALAPAARAAADAVAYARATQPAGALPLTRLRVYRPADSVVLDEAAQAHLELTQTLIGGKKQGSLLGVLDETQTAPGGRLLRRWLLFPLTDVAAIRRRQDAVELFCERAALRDDVRARLAEVYDLERLAGRVKLATATPRDLGALRRSLDKLPGLAAAVTSALAKDLAPPELLAFPPPLLSRLAAVAADLAATLADDPPAQGVTGAVRPGASPEIDELRRLADGGKDGILAIEAREKERTGIASLKVRYNRVFGYYLEITRANLKAVPADYVRKQTLANAERFVTPELAELEAKVLGAEDKLVALETQVVQALCARVAAELDALLAAAERIATLDVTAALAEVAARHGYVRPLVDDGELLEIDEGRHPVVERLAAAGQFVPNDVRLDPRGPQILVITGPNMAGKSTFMRQVAHIVLLAQMGAFVPAARARVGVVDRVFTRVGAADNLARGESTFMVEMRETAHILAHATRRSLVVLDEIGRGTSTYDGVSIAFAVAEYLHDACGAKTLFATHYHELTALATRRARVKNVSVSVREHKGEVVFLHRVIDGPAPRSYGIDVAKLAGLPRSVIARARQILAALEQPGAGTSADAAQLSLLAAAASPGRAPSPAASAAAAEILAALGELDPDATTPLQALSILADLKRIAAGGAGSASGG